MRAIAPIFVYCSRSRQACKLIIALLLARRAKMDGPYDSRMLPVLLAVILMVALLIVFSGAVAETAGWT